MAATTVKPFPHVQINVKDNSIASVQFVENLPVHRALYVMRTQEGPVGEPKWCNTYTEAVALFGEETFNPANKRYFSKAANFLLNTMTYNGAFIVRYLPTDENGFLPDPAKYVLFAQVKKIDQIAQYKYTNGQRELAFNEQTQEWEEVYETDEYGNIKYEEGVGIIYGTRALAPNETIDKLEPKKVGEFYEFPLFAFEAKYPGAYGDDLAIRLFYTANSNDSGDVRAYETLFYNIGFMRRDPNSSTVNAVTDIYSRENMAFAANPETLNPDTGASMGIDYVLDKGFSDAAHQLPVNFYPYTSNFAALGNIIAAFEKDVRIDNPSKDEAGNTVVQNAVESTSVRGVAGDPRDGARKKVKRDEYGKPVTDGDGNYIYERDEYGNIIYEPIPDNSAPYVTAYSLNGYDNTDPIGALTQAEKDAVKNVYFGDADDEEKKAVAALTLGFKVNALSCEGITGIPYDHAYILDKGDAQTGFTAANLNRNSQFFLEGGSDGVLYGDDGHSYYDANGKYVEGSEDESYWASDDQAMYDFCNLHLPVLKDTIVESLHYPFTHIFDYGFSMKTKKAILKFLDVRDDFMAIMSTQVLMADGSGRSISVNDMAKDEANLEALRAYALLMRESVLFGTDCMRCAIYCHTGWMAEGVYTDPVPFTYWSAMKYAQCGNISYMKSDEPRGLPNAYNLYFKRWNWNNYRMDAQSRVWDEGGNYCQYADMTRLFYPALRTVYRAATSVLVDEWFVAAVVYAKYVAKRAWAQFSGRNDSAPVLQGAIKAYLDKELAALFNNKYTFETTVYQTADEQEIGYIQHVKMSITSPATMRVLDVDIEVNREGFTPEE